MAEPTITQVFGAGASQDATTITIIKSDLVSTGLTTSATNTAESLLAAILLKAKVTLTQTGFDSNSDQSIVIEPGFDSIVTVDDGTVGLINYRQSQLNINLHRLDAGGIDPDDY